jgi:hypothetical protein
MRAHFIRGENPLDTLDIGRIDEREVKETMALFVKNHKITAKIEEYQTPVFYDNEFTEEDIIYYLGVYYDKGVKKYVGGIQSLSGPNKGICDEGHFFSMNSAYFKLEKYYES